MLPDQAAAEAQESSLVELLWGGNAAEDKDEALEGVSDEETTEVDTGCIVASVDEAAAEEEAGLGPDEPHAFTFLGVSWKYNK